MISQLTIFGEELELTDQPSYRGGSHASRTALQESVMRLLTNVISGQKCGELLAKLSPTGLWLKTYQGCYQARMDGSFEEFSEILPSWGLMLDGQLIQPHGLEPSIDESGWRLLPTPIASDAEGGVDRRRRTETGRVVESSGNTAGLKLRSILCDMFQIQRPHPAIYEAIMGYGIGHTALDRSETQ